MDIVSTNIRKARKAYQCLYCAGDIVKGDKHQCDVIADYGDIYNFRAHLQCAELAEILHGWYNMYSDEGFDFNTFKEAVIDYATSYAEIPNMPEYIEMLLKQWGHNVE